MLTKKQTVAIVLIALAFSACRKEPGEGGLATLEGALSYNTYAPNGDFLEKIPAGDENVYLTYGDNTPYDDRTDTYPDGSFMFKGLRKGSYVISAYSDCGSCASGIAAVEVEAEITGKKGVTSAGDIVVAKYLDYNDGTSAITGTLMQDEYTKSPPIVVQATYPQPDVYVYITYGNDASYFNRVKSGANGIFSFTGLLKGTYTIYAFSDCANCSSGTDTKETTLEITGNGSSVDAGILTIEKR